ncbi:uncharacterized protein LOC105695461 isoform X2 [Orussus abietinus]|uniref:uncharacterized protein LOC105695461 isoform X2 n=1 Tax=Orussus abietinus TaxID=222816 RepID=UPI000626C089|nr:uncharacterized protein LOC105695461 isoform X2 [Orussus abietinus]
MRSCITPRTLFKRKPVEFHMLENSNVKAEFRGCDVDNLEVFVRGLATPLGKVPEAVLRTSDIIYFDVNGISPS